MSLRCWKIQGIATKYNEILAEIEKMFVLVFRETEKKGTDNEKEGNDINFYSEVNKNNHATAGVWIAIAQNMKKALDLAGSKRRSHNHGH